MSVDFKKLSSFVKIVDTGSMSRAANTLADRPTGVEPARRRARGAFQAQAASAQQSRRRARRKPASHSIAMRQAMLKQLDSPSAT